MRETRIVLVVALALAALAPSCVPVPFRKHKAAVVPPPAPAPVVPVAPPEPRQVSLPDPLELPAAEPDIEQAGPAWPGQELPPPPKRRTRPPRPHEDADVTPPVPETPAAPAPVPLPQLEQVLTPEQRQAYAEEIERNIANARKAVAALEGRRLSREQTTYLARVRAFIEQADEARRGDLFRARNLSERASVLADDLLKSVQ